MITVNTTGCQSSTVIWTFLHPDPGQPPPYMAGQPAYPVRPPDAPPVLAAARAPDGAWEVPATHGAAVVAVR